MTTDLPRFSTIIELRDWLLEEAHLLRLCHGVALTMADDVGAADIFDEEMFLRRLAIRLTELATLAPPARSAA